MLCPRIYFFLNRAGVVIWLRGCVVTAAFFGKMDGVGLILFGVWVDQAALADGTICCYYVPNLCSHAF